MEGVAQGFGRAHEAHIRTVFSRLLNVRRESGFQHVVIIDRLATMLGTEELERYARHIVLREVGGPGQAKLKTARVLVVGAGGLGAPVLLYLAAAGVGTLGIVDEDNGQTSNLQRKIIFATADIGRPKVEASADTVKGLNPLVNVETHHVRLAAANAIDLISRYDIVADGSDNFATRYLVSDGCYFEIGRASCRERV